ncbi:tail fiber domain-containing protein [Pontibacter sp. G13]|uniref:tail fiber domain-containing protein n=1 Tax=Pontibacter sp. G13 TaxID=3074898 RepID=UPI00288BF4C0|nr:tail fiber domain-containing protein [Pontibacter sp. G13]WNJ16999.1 tail fiber domain-containing protein [Pontibacter sp. G13]
MKRCFLFCLAYWVMLPAFAQSPGIPYQAVIRDGSGNILATQLVDMRVTIQDGATDLYRETHTTSTNAFGLVNLSIGTGTAQLGTFAGIDWTVSNPQIFIELNLGVGWVAMGTTPIRQVPYSIRSERSDIADQMELHDLLDVDGLPPLIGQVLMWDGGAWVPQDETVISYTAGAGIDLTGNVITNTGDLDPTDDLLVTSTAAGDVTGTFSTLNVGKIQGNPVDPKFPQVGQILKWDGNEWALDWDLNDQYTAGAGIDITNNIVTNTGDIDHLDDVVDTTLAGGDISGVFSALTVEQLQGNPVDPNAPAPEQILKWDGAQWTLSPDLNDQYTAGDGIDITNNIVTNTGDIDHLDDVVDTTLAGGDISGVFSALTVEQLQGNPVDPNAPAPEQILKWDGAQWTLSPDLNDQYTAGDGIDITNNIVTNTGDIDHLDDVVDTTLAGGDISGVFSGLTVQGIQGNPVNSTPPAAGQVLKWDGNQWGAGTDEDNDLWSVASTGIYYNGGKVGIGTAIPEAPLHIAPGNTLLIGADTLGPGAKMMWAASKSAFRVGIVNNLEWDTDSMGSYSVGMGISTKAKGYNSVAMGRYTVASGTYATAMGYQTRATGIRSTAFGILAEATGVNSTAMGSSTLASGTTSFAIGSNSEAVGTMSTAMGSNTLAQGTHSLAAGFASDATGEQSFALGYYTVASGNRSTALGAFTQAQAINSVAIGQYNVGGGTFNNWVSSDPIFEVGIGTSATTRENAMTILKNGFVGIGTIDPDNALHVEGKLQLGSIETLEDFGTFLMGVNCHFVPTTDNAFFMGNTANRWFRVHSTNGVVNTSDAREKTQIQPIEYGLETVMKLKPVSFQWKSGPDRGVKLGLIAQDLQQTVPEVVVDSEIIQHESGEWETVPAEKLGVYYADLIPVLIQGMQDQQAEIEALKAQISSLQQQINQP